MIGTSRISSPRATADHSRQSAPLTQLTGMAAPTRHDRLPDAGESRAAVSLTVVWMLTCLATAAALAVVVALRLVMATFPGPAGGAHPLAQMASVLTFVAVVTGVMCLALTPLALRTRKTPPPRSVTVTALVIGALPILVLIVGAILNG